MSSTTYKIHRWDTVLFGNREYPTPIIYIKPDDNLFEFTKANKDDLLVRINSSKSIYDKKNITGVFASSAEIPNCRPVFFNKTALYVIVLQCEWYGYPDFLGNCEILGLKRGVDYKRDENVNLQKPLFNPNTFTENYSKSTENYSMKNEIIIGIIITIFIILLISLFLTKNNRSNK